MEVKFKEFIIPAATVQTDSVNSQIYRSTGGDRWLCGKIDNPIDPNFGKINASIFTKIKPGPKLYKVNRSDFTLIKASVNLVLDYYVYGDTLESESIFTLHNITDGDFSNSRDYFTNSTLNFDPTPVSTGTYAFKYDSIKKYSALNSDDLGTANNVYDSLTFDLPIDGGLAKILFDTLKGRGIFLKQKKSNGTDTLVYSTFKNDSVFNKTFKGLAVQPQSGNRVLGFTSRVGSSLVSSSRIALYFSYLDLTDNVTKFSKYYFYFQDPSHYQDIPNFTRIETERTSTNLANLSSMNKYTNFSAPDGFCYVQAGTGVYSKLDFTAVMDTFNLYDKITFNSAELIIPVEPSENRTHIKAPEGLFLRVAKDNFRFFVPPVIPAINANGSPYLVADPLYGSNYHCTSNETFLDAVGDENSILVLELTKDDNARSYRGFLTQFFEYHSRLPSNVPRVNFMGLVPATYYAKSLNGVSFRSDDIKLRVYYSIPR